MPRLSRFQVMQHVAPKIINYLKNVGTKIYSVTEIDQVLRENKNLWLLPSVTTSDDFVSFLIGKNILKEVSIKLPQRTVKKFIYGNVSDYEIAVSINKNSYCTHYTAMLLHGLTDNIPKSIYTNTEQFDKTIPANNSGLEQINVDKAFSRPMRETNQIAIYNDKKIYLLNGKNVANVGVSDILIDDRSIKVTNIERTLIDIVVRPNYAGGTQEILDAYKAAKGKCSINKLVSILKKMDYTYPYHQAIGFYLERAGYEETSLKLIEKMNMDINFYLTYQMKDPDYSKRWKLFIPKGF